MRRRVTRALPLATLWLALSSTGFAQEPANVGDAKIAATKYHDSGEYAQGLAAVGAQATEWLLHRAGQVARPALILDIDETALSNWEVIKADDFGRVFGGPCDVLPQGPCGWVAWDMASRGVAIGPTLGLYRAAKAAHVAVFFISGRDEHQREATIRNLNQAGYHDWDGLFLAADGAHFASAADFKTPIRAKIAAEGYDIIENVGDQPSDLAGGYSERVFLLPDPFYRIP